MKLLVLPVRVIKANLCAEVFAVCSLTPVATTHGVITIALLRLSRMGGTGPVHYRTNAAIISRRAWRCCMTLIAELVAIAQCHLRTDQLTATRPTKKKPSVPPAVEWVPRQR